MAVKCEVCGSADITKQGDVFVCQGCGIQYTLDAIKAMASGGVAVAEPMKKTYEACEKVDVSNLISNADKAISEGNLEAAKTYLMHAQEKDPDNVDVLYRMIEHGFGGDLKKLIELAPDDRKNEFFDYAYRYMERPSSWSLAFSATMMYEYLPMSIQEFMGKTLPEMRIEGFFDEKRYLTAFAKCLINAMKSYELPESTKDGIFADAYLLYCCKSVEGIDKLISNVYSAIPAECLIDVHTAFSDMCTKISNSKWYTNDSKTYASHKITQKDTALYVYMKIIKDLGENHRVAVGKIKAKADEEMKAAKKAAEKAYWDAHPEEYKAKKEAEKKSKLEKLQKELEKFDCELKSLEQQCDEHKKNIERIEKERQSLGMFQGKLKKQLLNDLTSLQSEQWNIEDKIAVKKDERPKLVSKINAMQKEIDNLK